MEVSNFKTLGDFKDKREDYLIYLNNEYIKKPSDFKIEAEYNRYLKDHYWYIFNIGNSIAELVEILGMKINDAPSISEVESNDSDDIVEPVEVVNKKTKNKKDQTVQEPIVNVEVIDNNVKEISVESNPVVEPPPPVVEKTKGKKTVKDTPVKDTPVVEKPPVVEKSKTKKTVKDTPVVETSPVVQTPVVEKPKGKKTSKDTPVVETPPVVEKIQDTKVEEKVEPTKSKSKTESVKTGTTKPKSAKK